MHNISGGTPDDLLNAAVGLHKAGDFGGAERMYRQVLAAEPRHAVALNLLGLVMLGERRLEPAIDMFHKALAERPDIADTHNNLATALEESGRNDEAILHYRFAMELDRELAAPRERLAAMLKRNHQATPADTDSAFGLSLAKLAAACASRANVYGAIRLYERALDHNPDQGEVLSALGWLMIRGKQPEYAAGSFRTALAMKHGTAEVYHGLATALHKTRELKEALEVCNQALKLDPDNMDIQWTYTQIQAEIYQFSVDEEGLRVALAKDPANKDLQFRWAALRRESAIDFMPPKRIADAFDGYAENFDAHLVQQLNYRGPELILACVREAAPNRRFDILDLGCGTGLCGAALKPLARRMIGVDLSTGMIERCRGRGIYDELGVEDLLMALRRQSDQWDLIVAGDVFAYVGELDEVFAAAMGALRRGGLFAFCVERTDEPRFTLNRTTFRFSYNGEYLLELGKRHGMVKKVVRDEPFRRQYGRPVAAWTMLFEKPE
jgi:predicted TPR repeat methyltransferase